MCSCTDSGISLVEANVAFPLCHFPLKVKVAALCGVCCSIVVSERIPFLICVEKCQSLPNQGLNIPFLCAFLVPGLVPLYCGLYEVSFFFSSFYSVWLARGIM